MLEWLPVSCFAIGCFVGGVLVQWGRTGRFPLPKLPVKDVKPEESNSFKPPVVKP